MTAVTAIGPALPASRVLRLVLRTHWHRPEWCAAALAVGGWAVLASAAVDDPSHHLGASGGHGPIDAVTHSAVMGSAMMTPLVLFQVNRAATSSLWPRRYRAAGAFLVGFVGVWTVVGAVTLAAGVVAATWIGRAPALAGAFAIAAVTPFAPGRRRRLRRCGATRPLRPRGLASDTDCVAYGVRTGMSCVATCWPLMVAVMIDHGLAIMVAASIVLVRERRSYDPRPLTTAVSVAVIGAASVGVALATG